MRFFLEFYHICNFTLLCLPKGCLLLSNRLSLKKSLEEATEELRRLWKGQLWRERALWMSWVDTPCWCRASSKHRGGSSWLRPSRRGSRLIRSRRSSQKHAKVDEKLPKSGQNGAPEGVQGAFLEARRPKMDARGAKRPILVLKSVPQGCQNGSQRSLKRL